MTVLNSQLPPERNMADNDLDDWSGNLSPEVQARMEAQARIDIGVHDGTGPNLRDLIAILPPYKRRTNPISAEVIQPVADTTR